MLVVLCLRTVTVITASPPGCRYDEIKGYLLKAGLVKSGSSLDG
jgi:hypothetical protein